MRTVATLLASALLLASPAPRAGATGQVGDVAADFTLGDLDQGTWTLSGLRGTIVFLNVLGFS